MGSKALEPALTVTVNVDEITLDTVVGTHSVWIDGGEDYDAYREEQPMTLREAIVDRMVNLLLADKEGTKLRGAIEKARRELVDGIVKDVVREILLEPFQPMTAYGEKQGDVTTLRALIVAKAEAALRVKVDNSYGGRVESVLDKVVREETGSVLAKELQAALAAEREKAVAAMRAAAADVIAKTLAGGIGGR